ncbi:hypothetical protein Droror1_Dr00012215 [Drosera rotundifolia]
MGWVAAARGGNGGEGRAWRRGRQRLRRRSGRRRRGGERKEEEVQGEGGEEKEKGERGQFGLINLGDVASFLCFGFHRSTCALLSLMVHAGYYPNTLTYTALIQGNIDVIKYVIDQMHQEEVQPDPSTNNYVFAAYAESEYFSTAIEALQVLSMRMISLDENILQQKRLEFEEDFV